MKNRWPKDLDIKQFAKMINLNIPLLRVSVPHMDTRAQLHAVRSRSSTALMFTAHFENGTNYNGLRLEQFFHTVPTQAITLHLLQPWSCHEQPYWMLCVWTVPETKGLRSLRWFVGEYICTFDFVEGDYPDNPEEFKTLSLFQSWTTANLEPIRTTISVYGTRPSPGPWTCGKPQKFKELQHLLIRIWQNNWSPDTGRGRDVLRQCNIPSAALLHFQRESSHSPTRFGVGGRTVCPCIPFRGRGLFLWEEKI